MSNYKSRIAELPKGLIESKMYELTYAASITQSELRAYGGLL
jgi:hypothetical protein